MCCKVHGSAAGSGGPLPLSTWRTAATSSPLSCLSFGQPPTAQIFGRDAGQVGLNIENRCPIEHIDAANMQLDAVAATQLDGGQADRVRTSRRSGGKHTMRPIVGGRCTE